MSLPRAVALFAAANVILAWLGLAGVGGSTETVSAPAETALVSAGDVPPYASSGPLRAEQ